MTLSDQLFNWFDHKVHQSEKINSLQLLNPDSVNVKRKIAKFEELSRLQRQVFR